jgi:hypothetical protein
MEYYDKYINDGYYCLNRKEAKRAGWFLFLIGLGSLTQIRIGFSIGISEIFVYLVAPFLYIKNANILKRDGLMPLLFLGFLVNIMNVVAGYANQIPAYLYFKGFASTYPLLAFPVVLHHLLSKNPTGHRWLFLGVAISNVVNIFMFRTSYELEVYTQGAQGGAAVEAIMSGPIFWIGRLANFIRLPFMGWFWQTPLGYTILAPIGLAAFSMLTSESGRSAALGALGSSFIAIFCVKSRERMRAFGRNIWLIIGIGVVGVFIAHAGYRYAASNGILGEDARDKYEHQTKGEGGILKLLMGGRGEFFIGFLESLNKPWIGHGPWAIDNGEATMYFLEKYGNAEDYEKALESRRYRERIGGSTIGYIPAHSHIVGFFLWFGVIGLIYWLYVLYAIFRYLHKEMAAAPHWFGVLALGAPSFLWTLFFSGFGYRIVTMPYVVLLFMAHSYYIGAKRLPIEIEMKIRLSEKK